METRDLYSGRESLPRSNRIITQEEYEALMAELGQAAGPECIAPLPDIAEKVRKLEFNMLILVELILVVFILCRIS